MTYKRTVLGLLSKAELLAIGRGFELAMTQRMSVDELRDVVASSKRATLERILPELSRDLLKAVCDARSLSTYGREKQVLIARILDDRAARSRVPADVDDDDTSALAATSTSEDALSKPRFADAASTHDAFMSEDGTEVVEDDGEEALVHPYDPSKNNIITKSMSMDLMIKRLEHQEIDLMPDFQREGNLWDDQRMSRLVESLLIRLPLPVFYFDATDESKWLVVDGLQRLSTLQKFVVDKQLVLNGLEYLKSYQGMIFTDLPRDMQRRIEETQIVAHMIQPGTPPEVKYNIFRRINTGGLALTGQEIRHALNPGKAGRFLSDLSKLDSFQIATDHRIASKRMLDREFVLRFLAFTLAPYDKYEGPSLDWFLTAQMAEMNKARDQDLETLKLRFEQAMTLAHLIFGQHAFRKQYKADDRRRPINKALFEAWSVALGELSTVDAQRIETHARPLRAGFLQLMADQDFEKAISQGTGDPAKVRKRFAAISMLVEETLRQ